MTFPPTPRALSLICVYSVARPRPMSRLMYVDCDRWRDLSRRAGEKFDSPRIAVRFSRRLLVASALFFIVIGFLDLL